MVTHKTLRSLINIKPDHCTSVIHISCLNNTQFDSTDNELINTTVMPVSNIKGHGHQTKLHCYFVLRTDSTSQTENYDIL